jgi:tetratricopeptide (TPR) repeat protein
MVLGMSRWIPGLILTVAAGCAQIVPALVLNYGPDLFAVAVGDQGLRPEFREAAPLLQKKDWKGLLELTRVRLQRDSSRGEWWQLAGYAHMQLGEMAEARDCFVRVTRLQPEEVNGWNFYAYSLKSLGDARGALAAVKRAIEINPYSGTSYVILGELYRDSGSTQASLKAYQRAIEINNEDAFAWLGVGILGKRNRDAELYEKARKALRQLSPELAAQLEKA